MKYLTFIVALLLSTSISAQEIPKFLQINKPIICAQYDEIMKIINQFEEKPFAYWLDVDGTTVVLMYKSEKGGLTIMETYQSGMACVISTGTDIQLSKKGIDF